MTTTTMITTTNIRLPTAPPTTGTMRFDAIADSGCPIFVAAVDVGESVTSSIGCLVVVALTVVVDELVLIIVDIVGLVVGGSVAVAPVDIDDASVYRIIA